MDKLFFRMIFLLWVALILLNLAVPNKDFSESENRYLSRFPSFSVETLLNGKFMGKVDEYFNDHFVGRDNWITIQNNLEYSIGKRETNGVFLCKNALMANISTPKENAVTGNIAGIRSFSQQHELPCYLMLVPSAAAVQSEQLPNFAQVWDQADFIKQVSAQLEDAVTTIQIYDTLRAHKDDYIYYRTDHHWTTDGAFLAYQQYCSALKLPARTPANFKINTVNNSFIGTLASKSGAKSVKADSIKTYQIGEISGYTVFDGKKESAYPSVYFKDYLSKKDKYAYFLGPNQPVVTIKTQSPSGKRLLIFKDSYAHSFAPLLAEDYSEITLVDLRYINVNIDKFIDVTKFDHALFLYSTEVFSQQNLLSKLQ